LLLASRFKYADRRVKNLIVREYLTHVGNKRYVSNVCTFT